MSQTTDATKLVPVICRLRREDEASVIRLRWYGPRSLKPDHKIYVEKKVHREPWTNEQGYKVTVTFLTVSSMSFAILADRAEISAQFADITCHAATNMKPLLPM